MWAGMQPLVVQTVPTAVPCAAAVCMPDGVMLANARVLSYVRENGELGSWPGLLQGAFVVPPFSH